MSGEDQQYQDYLAQQAPAKAEPDMSALRSVIEQHVGSENKPQNNKEFNPVSELETFYGGYKSEEEMVDAIVADKSYSHDEKGQILEEVQKDIDENSYELSKPELERLQYKVSDERSRVEDQVPATPQEQAVAKKNEAYLAEKNQVAPTEKSAAGKLPVLKTHTGTKAELKAIKNSKSGNLNVD